jgi:hypothetical protein
LTKSETFLDVISAIIDGKTTDILADTQNMIGAQNVAEHVREKRYKSGGVVMVDYVDILRLIYNKEENIFYDADLGHQIVNIFEMITPNDLLLFKKNPEWRYFQHRSDEHTLCELIMEENLNVQKYSTKRFSFCFGPRFWFFTR